MKDVAILRPLQNEKFLRLPAAVATQTGTHRQAFCRQAGAEIAKNSHSRTAF